MSPIWLLLTGVLVGAFGTLIGAGGGFLLVPLLIFLYPSDQAETITSISLAVVFFNALSGSIAYARMKRIDYYSGIRFSLAAVPGAILGAATISFVPRRAFDLIFGVFLLLVGGALLIRRPPKPPETSAPLAPGKVTREITEGDGTRHLFSYDPKLGMVLSLLVGFVSSLLGIGGGIIHVPALVYLLGFPAHIATATSHFILAVMSLAGTGVHIATGAFTQGAALRTLWLGVGALVGAQLGARLSRRVHGKWILRSLAAGLMFVGVRILLLAI